MQSNKTRPEVDDDFQISQLYTMQNRVKVKLRKFAVAILIQEHIREGQAGSTKPLIENVHFTNF